MSHWPGSVSWQTPPPERAQRLTPAGIYLLTFSHKLQWIMQCVVCAAVCYNSEGREYLVALFSCAVVPVGIGEVNVTGSVLHDLLNVPAPFPDHMRVLRVWDVHLQRDFIHLCTGELLWDRHREDEQRNQRSSNLTLVSRSSKILRLASRTFALFPSTFTWGSEQKYTNHHNAFYFITPTYSVENVWIGIMKTAFIFVSSKEEIEITFQNIVKILFSSLLWIIHRCMLLHLLRHLLIM